MTRNDFLKELEETFKQGLELVKKKNADYAEDNDPFLNFRNSTAVGVSLDRGILVRSMDKMTRISHLLDRDGVVKDEKIDDTLLDLINYIAILKVYLNDKSKN